jgi:hypothetical protein
VAHTDPNTEAHNTKEERGEMHPYIKVSIVSRLSMDGTEPVNLFFLISLNRHIKR